MADLLSQQKTPAVRDWENREFIEAVSLNMRKLVDFINKFGLLFLIFIFILLLFF